MNTSPAPPKSRLAPLYRLCYRGMLLLSVLVAIAEAFLFGEFDVRE